MKLTSHLTKILPTCALLAVSLFSANALRAQAQFAGTYTGTINIRVTVPIVGTTESSSGGYIAVVSATGTILVNGGNLAGTVNAAGTVTFTSGPAFDNLAIVTATIANNQLSSAYGGFSPGSNNTTQFKLNPSTAFTPASGGGGNTAPAITSALTANAVVGVPFNYQMTASPAATSFAITASSFGVAPVTPGSSTLVFSPSTGLATANFTAAGTQTISFAATNAAGSSPIVTLTITVTGGGATAAPVITSAATGAGNVGVAYAYQIVATNAPTAYAAIGLPAGITISPTTGLISGTPAATAAGTYQINLTATNALGATTARLTLVIGAAVATANAPANLVGYRGKNGQTFQFTLTGAAAGTVWGSDYYTDDSTLARAAVHAGVVAVGETKLVTVTLLGGQAGYAASTRNGVTTASWPAWPGSYAFSGATGAVATAVPTVASGFVAATTALAAGGRFVCPVTVSGGGTYTYRWYLNNSLINGATLNPYVVDALTAANAGTYTVDVTNALGTARLAAGTLAVGAAGSPVIALQPISKTVVPGATVSFATSATGAGLAYQWFRNGTALAGETGPILLRNNVNAADAGTYTVRVTNAAGTVTSAGGVLTLSANASRPANISVRTNVATGQLVTPGFVLQGAGTKRVLLRAVGPGLALFGLTGLMADPKLTVFQGTAAIATNDDWSSANAAAAIAATGAFPITAGSKDAALVTDLAAGKDYTVQVTNATGQGGLVIIEVYDADILTGTSTSKLVNVSVRGQTAPGADVLTLGLVINGIGQRTLLVRGIGPGLAAFGVTGTVADPRLQIFDSQARAILANDDWGNADFVGELGVATTYVGAFNLAAGSRDAATLSLVDPGAYTIQVSGAAAAPSGEALVEVYEVP
jgi:LCCL domain/Putative Ig domain